MDFNAAPSRGGLVGLALVGLALAVLLGLLAAALWRGAGPAAALLLLAAAVMVPVVARLAVWLWGYATLRYTVTRDGILIRWGATDQVIPMADITHVLNGRPYASRRQGLAWPGHEVGHTTTVTDDGVSHPTLVFATVPPDGQVLVVTPGLAYAISPSDRSAFVEEFRIRSRLGPVQQLQQGTDQPAWAQLPIWHDGPALRLLVAAFVMNLLAFMWLLWHYPTLPAEMPVQFGYDAVRRVAMPGPLRPRATVWLLPLIGLAATLLNGSLAIVVHQRLRLAAFLLLVGALLLQLALAVSLAQVT
jgi:membrane protein YdbS with pleckstrin-like domain